MPSNKRNPKRISGQPASRLKLSLMENAYGFLNQSVSHYRKTARNIHEWPFALLHITQSIELMLKQVLKGIHPILIFEDVDNPKHTVSLERSLSRLESLGVKIDEKEKLNIRRAANYRNLVVHYEFELNRFEWKRIYTQLFEFVHFLHLKHFNEEIHSRIAREHWPTEARLMTLFKKEFVIYHGVEMYKELPYEIMQAQRVVEFEKDHKRYARIKYGDEPGWLAHNSSFADIPCHDCGVIKGQYHAEHCDVEECPGCHRQLLGCGCRWQHDL